MILPAEGWTPFSSPEEQLEWLKAHKLTPQTYEKPKKIFYEGIYTKDSCECTVVGFVDDWTAVIRIDDQLHCIHPDLLVEMQVGKSMKSKGTLLPDNCDFIAIDFETATKSKNSACEIGIAFVSNLEVVNQYRTLIRPPKNKYDSYNSNIHRITSEDTEHEKTFSEHWKVLKSAFGPVPVLAHSAGFDIAVLKACLGKKKCDNFPYLDTMKMVRDIVPGKHGLSNCCEFFDVDLKDHHNAGDDAVACAQVAIACIKASDCDTLEEFCKKHGIGFTMFHLESAQESAPLPEKKERKKQSPSYFHKKVKIADIQPTVDSIDENNPLFGKRIVFTGDLSIDRSEAMQIAVNAGAIPKTSVSSKTNYLVVGTQDPSLTGEGGISTKEIKAKRLIESGLSTLEIIDESQFFELAGVGGVLSDV